MQKISDTFLKEFANFQKELKHEQAKNMQDLRNQITASNSEQSGSRKHRHASSSTSSEQDSSEEEVVFDANPSSQQEVTC